METARRLFALDGFASSGGYLRDACCHVSLSPRFAKSVANSIERGQANEEKLDVLEDFEFGALIVRIDVPRRMGIEFLARPILDRERALRHQRQFRRRERAQRMRGAARSANETSLQAALAE